MDFGLGGTNPVSRAIFPAYKDVDEKVHILKFDISHEIGGVTLEDDFSRGILRSADQAAFPPHLSKVGEPVPDNATRAKEEQDHFEAVKTSGTQKSKFVTGSFFRAAIFIPG